MVRYFNLQLFNDEADGTDASQTSGEKTFTQSELDNIIAKRLARQEKQIQESYKNTDEYKAFQTYQENQKTQQEKFEQQAKTLQEYEQRNQELQSKINEYNNKQLLKDVKSEFKDYAYFEINKLVDDKTDFESAYKKFTENEKNKSFLNLEQEEEKETGFGFTTGKRHTQGNSTNAEMDNLRKWAGL